jgi:agmatine/peptidylarginine deiminase
MEVWLRLPRASTGWNKAKLQIQQAVDQIRQIKAIARVDVILDVDPVS